MSRFRRFQYLVIIAFWGVIVPGFVLFYWAFYVAPGLDR
jgi:hypothetical protein